MIELGPDAPLWLVAVLAGGYVLWRRGNVAPTVLKGLMPDVSGDKKDWWRMFFEHRRAVVAARREHRRARRQERHERRKDRRAEREKKRRQRRRRRGRS